MKRMMAALLVVFSAAAYAEENPLQFDPSACTLDSGGVLSLQTLPMPKGWFTSKGTFDRSKTDVRTSYTLSTTSCDKGAGEATISSTKLGTFFKGVWNPQEKDVGYIWNMLGDLSANQNHWWYFYGCDGAPVKVGCDQPRDATFTVTAYGQDGQCRTFVNGYGITTCAGDTVELQLASVQDPDQLIDPALCEDSCGIGPCVSARVNAGGYCDTTFPVDMQLDPKSRPDKPKYYDANEKARSDCKGGAVCYCKSLRPATCNDNGNDCE